MNPFCCSSTLERGLHIFSSNELTSIRNRRRHSPLPHVTRYCYTAGNRHWNKFNKIKLNYVKNPKQNADMEDYSVSPGRVLRKRRYSVLRFVLRTQLLKSYTGVVVDVKFCYTTLCLRVIVFLNANKREGNLPRERRFGFLSSPCAHEEKTGEKNP